MFVYIIFSLLLIQLTIFSLCVLTICNVGYFPFWFCGQDLALFTPVPGHY